MRSSLMGLALLGGLTLLSGSAVIAPAAAQSPFDGPLASPDAPAVTPAPASHKKTKAKKVHHAAAKPATTTPAATADGGTPPPEHVPTAAPGGGGSADDPLSLGMKWNGNNDSAGETRSQNLDGNAFGTGAEVGMKLHF